MEPLICRHCDQRFFSEARAEHAAHEAKCEARPAPVASNIADFALARADRGSRPRDHKADDALALARAWMDECGPENQPDHIIVFMGRTTGDNGSGTKYFQTGSFSPHAQVGLVYEALDLLRNSDK